ncbi:MAG: radical SAM family heme chaperone HemW [Candidatus Krumholzibacteriota bacterium]|nr:radical SAM family heme chaperone HemW [Candidatus Krumholzibacteriota bacterium]
MMTDSPPGLYVHIPFCAKRCSYCDFYSEEKSSLVKKYFELLGAEAGSYSSLFREFGTLYLGGGTPSLPEAALIEGVIDALSRIFDFVPGRETTIEVNPDDITKEKARSYAAFGINRISVGIQSFDDAELTFLGRRHDSDTAVKAIDILRSEGFSNIGIDLIYGFHDHTEESWRRTLVRAVKFLPEHVSCYQMTVPVNTRMGDLLAEGKISEIPDDLQRRLFILTDKVLTENGYIHYEVSNFARGEEYISRHNTRYWDRTDYLGLGPSAHSYRSDCRWWNVSSVEEYCTLLEKGGDPVIGREELTQAQIDLEDLYLGFRTRKGAALSLIAQFVSGDRILGELAEDRLVSIQGEYAVPTLSGFLVADRLPLLFY